MPKIAEFSGIVIKIHNNDHWPPHFHAFCDSDEVKINIRSGKVEELKGSMPPNILRKLGKYHSENKKALLKTFFQINPTTKKVKR